MFAEDGNLLNYNTVIIEFNITAVCFSHTIVRNSFILVVVNRPGDTDEECVGELLTTWRQRNIDDDIVANVGLVTLACSTLLH